MTQSITLEQLALTQFQSLNESETKLLRAARHGELAHCGGTELEKDTGEKASDSDNESLGGEIRAELIRWICQNPHLVDVKGIRVEAARITGDLDLSYMRIPFPLRLTHCRLHSLLLLTGVEIILLDLKGSWVRSVSAERATVRDSLLLTDGFHCDAGVLLRGAKIGGSLVCENSRFHNNFNGATPDSGIALNAEAAHIAHSVLLRKNFSAKGQVRFFRCHIGGNLVCEDARFENPTDEAIPNSGMAINAETAQISGSVFLRKNFSATGQVHFFRCHIGGNFVCEDARFENPANVVIPDSVNALNRRAGMALSCEGMKIIGDILLRDNFSAQGQVRLFRAQIGGSVECRKSKFQNPWQVDVPNSGFSLDAAGVKVAGAFLFREDCLSEGQVRLLHAQIGRNLECIASTLNNAPQRNLNTGFALDAYGIEVEGSVLLRQNLVQGGIRLQHAKIGYDLDCVGSNFNNKPLQDTLDSGMALNAEAINVKGHVLLRDCSVEGEVKFLFAQVDGNVECDRSRFHNPLMSGVANSGIALHLEALRVGGGVFLRDQFWAEGQVRLLYTRIGRNLSCKNSRFKNPKIGVDNSSGTTLNAGHIRVDGNVLIFDSAHEGTLELRSARIEGLLGFDNVVTDGLDLTDAFAHLIADNEESWPSTGKLSIDGFVYTRIASGPTDASKRLLWLQRQSSFRRQPYYQLAHFLNSIGDDQGSRSVLSEMQRRVWGNRGWTARPLSSVLRLAIGYGYFPLRALWLLSAIVIIGTIVYSIGYDVGSIVPSQQDAYTFFKVSCYPPEHYERFQALSYSVENSFPLVKLGVQDKWVPSAQNRVGCLSTSSVSPTAARVTPSVLRWFRWIQICVGWVLTTLFVGGVTGVLRRN